MILVGLMCLYSCYHPLPVHDSRSFVSSQQLELCVAVPAVVLVAAQVLVLAVQLVVVCGAGGCATPAVAVGVDALGFVPDDPMGICFGGRVEVTWPGSGGRTFGSGRSCVVDRSVRAAFAPTGVFHS